jgi:hypothetical protein
MPVLQHELPCNRATPKPVRVEAVIKAQRRAHLEQYAVFVHKVESSTRYCIGFAYITLSNRRDRRLTARRDRRVTHRRLVGRPIRTPIKPTDENADDTADKPTDDTADD